MGRWHKKIRICYENGWMLGWCLFEGHVEFQRKVGSFGLFHIFHIFKGKKIRVCVKNDGKVGRLGQKKFGKKNQDML